MNALESNKRRLFGIIIVAVLVSAVIISRGLLVTAPRAERQTAERQARLVEVQVLQPSDQRVWISAYGQVEASQRINLAAQVAGRVTELSPNFVPGRRVRAGQILLQIDPADYQVAVDNAEANLASAQAALAQERGSQAVARGDFAALDMQVDASERALMLREPQLRAAEAKVRSAEAALAQARLNLQRCTLRAPLDSLVLSRSIGVGAQVSGANMALGELAAAEPFWVTLLVAVDELRWVQLPADERPGSEVLLSDVSQPQAAPWKGQVIQLLDAVESQGRRARLLVEVNPEATESGARLLLGSYVQARVAGRELQQVYQLDSAWLDGSSVWTVRDGRLQSVPVEVLHRDESIALVQGGLNPREKIVSSRLSSAVDGMRVRTADEAAAASMATAPPAESGAAQ
jgi:RND family efflux transporter MFP subunit